MGHLWGADVSLMGHLWVTAEGNCGSQVTLELFGSFVGRHGALMGHLRVTSGSLWCYLRGSCGAFVGH